MGTQLLRPQTGSNVSNSEPHFSGHTCRVLQRLISVVNLMNIDSLKTQVSELDCGDCLITLIEVAVPTTVGGTVGFPVRNPAACGGDSLCFLLPGCE